MSEIYEDILGENIVTDVSDIILGGTDDVCSPVVMVDGGNVCALNINICSDTVSGPSGNTNYDYIYYIVLDVIGIIENETYSVNDVLALVEDSNNKYIVVSAATQASTSTPYLSACTLTMSAKTGSDGKTYFVARTERRSLVASFIIKSAPEDIISFINIPGHEPITSKVRWYYTADTSTNFSALENAINNIINNPTSAISTTISAKPKSYKLEPVYTGNGDTEQKCIARYSPFNLTLSSKDGNSVSFHCFMKMTKKYKGSTLGNIIIKTPYEILNSKIDRPGYVFPNKSYQIPNGVYNSTSDAISINMNVFLPETYVEDDKIMTIDGLKELFPNINLDKAPFDLYIEDKNGKVVLNQNQVIKFADVKGVTSKSNLISLGIDSAQTRTIILAPGVSISPTLTTPDV